MSTLQIVEFLSIWTFVGIIAFSLAVVYLFRSGKVYEARTEEGHLKEKMPLKGLLNMLIFLALTVALITSANYASLIAAGIELRFLPLFGLDLALILLLIVYDTLVIDWWVIGHWRPVFLELPDSMDKEQMKVHIRRTFVVAPLFALLLAALSAGGTVWVW